jgi:3-deoxy-D-manno-octulosonic-acid transferase
MLWFMYNILFTVGYLLMLPKFLFRMWRRGGYKDGFLQRFGVYPPDVLQRLRTERRTWIHAVSVGEIQVALRFADEMRHAGLGTSFVITTNTSTAHALAEKKLSADDILLYFPSDFPFIVKRVLDLINPRALILTECELWPNLIRHTNKRHIPVILINGRISESSRRGYRLLRVFFSRVLGYFDLFLVQTRFEEECLLELGADPSRIKVLGTAKYDVAQNDTAVETRARKVLADLGIAPDYPILLGASTWPGEEHILLDIFKRLRPSFPKLRLVLVPRHAERRNEVEAEIRSAGITFVKRTDTNRLASVPEALLVDTTGELMGFYACATAVFVGKSLTNHGGQNIIEPAMLSKPVIVGPNMENFAAVVEDFLSAKAIVQVKNAEELERSIEALLRDKSMREEYGRKASSLITANQGVVQKSVKEIAELIAITKKKQ